MMGRGHSLSGAAIFLGATGAYTLSTGTPINPALLVMGTAVVTGAALLPDLDSFTATVTKSFGIFGRIFYYITNAVSLSLYMLTKTRKDEDKTNGHRTFTHTIIAAILFGLAALGLTSLPGSVQIFGSEHKNSEIAALVIMAFLLHLGVAGLFAPQLKKAKATFGLLAPYLIMVFTLIVTFVVAHFLPNGEINYQWLAIAISVGVFIHILGDTVTKMGTPMLWPIKIRGKRWYDVSLPAFMRITAGGTVETVILVPIFTLVALTGIILQVLISFGLIHR